MKAYPDNIGELSFLAALDDSSPYPPWFSALGAHGLLGHRQVPHPPPAPAEHRRRSGPRSRSSTRPSVRGGIEYRDGYLIDNDARFVFSFVRSAIEAGAAVANYVELVGAERVDGHWQRPPPRRRDRARS